MPNGVVNQVAYHLLNPHPVNINVGKLPIVIGIAIVIVIAIGCCDEGHAAGFGAGAERRRYARHNVGQRFGLPYQLQFAGFRFGQQAQVADQAGEVQGLAVQGVQGGGVRLEQPVLHGLNVALDVCQRRPQLVGDIRNQAAPLPLGVLQGIGHCVEGVPQFGDFVSPPDGYPLGEVALPQGAGGGGEAAHRAQGAAGQGQHQQHAHRAGGQAGQGQRVVDRLGELCQRRLAVRRFSDAANAGADDAVVRIPPPSVYADRPHDGLVGFDQREVVPGPAKMFPMPAFPSPPVPVGVGAPAVPHYLLVRVQHHDFPPRQQAGAFHNFLHARPAAVMVVVARQFPVDALGAGAILTGLDAVHFALRGIAGAYANGAGGQGQDGDEAQRQAQLQPEPPAQTSFNSAANAADAAAVRHCRSGSRRRGRFGHSGACVRPAQFCGAGWRCGHPRCGQNHRSRSRKRR